MPENKKYIINPDEGDIVLFYHDLAKKNKYAVCLQPRNQNEGRLTFNGVITTTKNLDTIYPGQYPLPEGIMPEYTKVLCDEPIPIYKKSVEEITGKMPEEELKEIRKRTAESLGINPS